MNPTIIGAFAVLVWGAALPISRILEAQLGWVNFIGGLFLIAGALGFLDQRRRGVVADPALLRNKIVWLRGFFFVAHEVGILTAIAMVSAEYVPLVILLNYLWPTAIILSSVLIAGVQITRPLWFGIGSLVVLGSLATELLGPLGIRSEMFASRTDCIAYLIAFFGALSWGLYSALSKRFGPVSGEGTVVPFFQLSLALVLPVGMILGHSTSVAAVAPESWWLLAGFGFSQFLAYAAWDLGVRRGNIVVLSLFADFIPWLSLASAVLLLDSPVGGATVVSAITLVLGAIITRFGTLPRRS